MTHPRTAVRNAFVAAINGIAGLNVFNTRFYPLAETELPACCVYATRDDVSDAAMDDVQQHTLTIAAKIIVKTKDAPEDTADAFALAVEKAIAADDTLGGAVLAVTLTGTDLDTDEDGDMPFMAATLSFTAMYVCMADDPETLI